MIRPTVHGIEAKAPRPTVLGAALIAAMVCLPLLVLWSAVQLI